MVLHVGNVNTLAIIGSFVTTQLLIRNRNEYNMQHNVQMQLEDDEVLLVEREQQMRQLEVSTPLYTKYSFVYQYMYINYNTVSPNKVHFYIQSIVLFTNMSINCNTVSPSKDRK